MVRVAAIFLLLLVGACSGRSTRHDDSPSGGDAGDDAGGGTGGSSSGGAGGSATGGTNSNGGLAGTASPTGGTPSTGGDAGTAPGGTGASGTSGAGGAGGAGGATECDLMEPPLCDFHRCPRGQTCMKTSGACVSSHCECVDGLWGCTDDCGGGICVDQPPCTTPNPGGCRSNEDCDTGYDCVPPVDTSCIPLDCACTALGNVWDCREMCGGGECVRST